MVMRKGNYPHQNDSLKHCQRYSGVFCNFDGQTSLSINFNGQVIWPVNLPKNPILPTTAQEDPNQVSFKTGILPLETFYTISNREYRIYVSFYYQLSNGALD